MATVVAKSPIQGVGVFATQTFSPGETVLIIDDSYVVDASHAVPSGEEQHCDYLEGGKTVWMQFPERHINHSCRPNVYVKTRNGLRHVVALREITPGEEITYDYCVNGYGDVVWQCHCGHSLCRHTIHSDFFHLPLELQIEYLPFLDDWFRTEQWREVEALSNSTRGRR